MELGVIAKKLLLICCGTRLPRCFRLTGQGPKGGRLLVSLREALIGLLFVLYTAIPWERLPS